MTEKEIGEIKRRLKYDKNNITKIFGCYVNTKKEILTEFSQTLGLMSLEQNEALFKIIKKTLSGKIGRNLHDIAFQTNLVGNSEEHNLLMSLKDSELKNSESVHKLYEKIANSYVTEENYLILLMCDNYDLPNISKNDETAEDDSNEMFRYILCSVCPVKLTKEGLGFYTADNSFKNIGAEMGITAPEIGFMFPSFDDRATNIYNALFYTRNTGEDYKEVTDTLFSTEVPMPADEQKETFQSLIAETAQSECSYEFVQSVHEHLTEIIEEHKKSRQDEPLTVGKTEIKHIFEDCGVSEESIDTFDEKYNESFGEKTEFNPENLIDTRQFEVKTPDVTVRVKPDKSYMVETKIVEGVKYIMIRAEEGVEVNGVKINFPVQNAKTSEDEN